MVSCDRLYDKTGRLECRFDCHIHVYQTHIQPQQKWIHERLKQDFQVQVYSSKVKCYGANGQAHDVHLHLICSPSQPILRLNAGHSSWFEILKVKVISSRSKVMGKMTCPCTSTLHGQFTYPKTGLCRINTLATAAAIRLPKSRSYLQGQRSWGQKNDMPVHTHLLRIVHIPQLGNVASLLWLPELPHDFFQDFQVMSKFKIAAPRSKVTGAK